MSMMRGCFTPVVSFLCSGLIACGATVRSSTPAPPDGDRAIGIVPTTPPEGFEATLIVESGVASSRRVVLPGDSITIGSEFTLKLRANMPAWFYVVFDGDDGPLILPATAWTVPQRAGEDLRFPSSMQAFQVEGRPGREHFFVIASRRPLDGGAAVITAIRRASPNAFTRPAATSARSEAPRSDPSNSAILRLRGYVDASTAAVSLPALDADLLLYEFVFQRRRSR